MVVLAVEGKYHNFEWNKAWPTSIWKFMLPPLLTCFIGATKCVCRAADLGQACRSPTCARAKHIDPHNQTARPCYVRCARPHAG
jgi:hypothetical protein